MEYTIEVTMYPHTWDDEKNPYFWIIKYWDDNYNEWLTLTTGWSVNPDKAWEEAKKHLSNNK